jgi:hypothetical protein
MIMRDVACAGYVAGCNTRWFAKEGDNTGFTVANAQQAIQSRLSFEDDVVDRYASMLAFPAWEGQFESGHLDTVMSVTSRLLPWEVNGAGQKHNSFPGGEDMFKQYNRMLNLGSVHYGEDLKAAENQDFISQVRKPRHTRGLDGLARTHAHTRPVCANAGLDQQFDLLCWAAPQV